MNPVPYWYVAVSALLGALGVGFGAMLTDHYFGAAPAILMLKAGLAWIAAGTAVMAWFTVRARRRAIDLLLLRLAGFHVAFTPGLVGVFLPWLGVVEAASFSGVVLLAGGAIVLAWQLWRAHDFFRKCWEKHHKKMLALCYDPVNATIDVSTMLWKLHVNDVLFWPSDARHQKWLWWGVLAMLVAVSRDLYEFEYFFYFVACCALLLLLVWTVSHSLMQYLLHAKLRAIEQQAGAQLAPMTDHDIALRRRQNRRRKKTAAVTSGAQPGGRETARAGSRDRTGS